MVERGKGGLRVAVYLLCNAENQAAAGKPMSLCHQEGIWPTDFINQQRLKHLRGFTARA